MYDSLHMKYPEQTIPQKQKVDQGGVNWEVPGFYLQIFIKIFSDANTLELDSNDGCTTL